MKSPVIRGEVVAVHRDAGHVTIALTDPRAVIWFECGDSMRTTIHGLTRAAVSETRRAVRVLRRAQKETRK